MAWLCVDRDGTEKISSGKPLRRSFKGVRILSALGCLCTGTYSKNNWNKWCNGWSTDKEDFIPFFGVILPKGSIEKLIGKKLTWKDEPVEI